MKKVSIFIIITLGILSIIALQGRALQRIQTETGKVGPEMVPVYIITFGYEWTAPVECPPCLNTQI